jgi:diguanylate cyclase (GGDEF)-like protein
MESRPHASSDPVAAPRLLLGWLFSAILLAAALALYLLHIEGLEQIRQARYVPWWTVALAFAATEAFTVDVDFERQPFTFSLSSLPLMVGLVFLSPEELVLVLGAGAVGLLVSDRAKPAARVFANISSLFFYNALTVVGYRLVLGEGSPVAARGWLAAGAAASIQLVVSNLTAELGIALEAGSFSTHSTRRAQVGSFVIEVLATASGLLLVVVLWHQPEAVWIPLFLVAGLLAVARAATRASQREAKLALLSEFMSQRSLDSHDLMASLLARVKQLLHCRSAEIVVVAGSHRGASLRLTMGPEGDLSATTPSTDELQQTLAGRAAMRDESVIVARHSSEAELLALLPRDAAMGGVAVPVKGEQGVLGAMVATDRVGLKVFDAGDRELLETVASHAGAVLESSLLLERLRSEAAAREHEATHDALTGCANRTLFRRRLEEAFERATGDGSIVGVLLIDLDHFKQLNDREGHHAGDAVLVEISARLETAVPPSATVGRLGGDEFAIVVPGLANAAAAAELAARLVEIISAPVQLDGVAVSVSASIGEAVYPDHATAAAHSDNASLLLRHADEAMYRAKGRRSGYVSYEHGAPASVVR